MWDGVKVEVADEGRAKTFVGEGRVAEFYS